jgi:hypothetical protein
VTEPLEPLSIRTRRLIRDAHAAGLEVVQVWEYIDGTVKLVTKLKGKADESVEDQREGDSWADVA